MEARLGVGKELVQKQLSRVTPSAASLFILSAGAYFASTLPYIPHVCDVWSSLSMNRMLGLSSGCPASRPFSCARADAGWKAGNAASEAAQNANSFLISIICFRCRKNLAAQIYKKMQIAEQGKTTSARNHNLNVTKILLFLSA
jgi:hypothetical protein